jgi:hypothetical protein
MPEKIAAFHESGHAVLAVASRFHNIVLPISIQIAYGEAFVSLSRTKVQAGGKSADVRAAQADPDIAADGAIVFLGGLASERRYCELVKEAGGKVEADASLSKNDYALAKMVLDLANVKTPLAELEAEAAKRADQMWPVIVEFAEELHKRQWFDPVEALEFIKPRIGK